MKIKLIKFAQKEIKTTVIFDNGIKIYLEKFGNDLVCIKPYYQMNKQNNCYMMLKKIITQSDYFKGDNEFKTPLKRDKMTIEMGTKMFIGKSFLCFILFCGNLTLSL